MLLLDEPTNFLDVAGVEWLESWFRDFRGAAIIVSHDRKFLDAVVTRIVEVENFHLHEYPGNFAEYVMQKQFRLKTLEAQFVHESELLAFEAEGIADRREAAKNASKGLGKQLAGIKKTRAPRPVDQIITEIYGGLHVKDVLCRVDGLDQVLRRAHPVQRSRLRDPPGRPDRRDRLQRQRQEHPAHGADRRGEAGLGPGRMGGRREGRLLQPDPR